MIAVVVLKGNNSHCGT